MDEREKTKLENEIEKDPNSRPSMCHSQCFGLCLRWGRESKSKQHR